VQGFLPGQLVLLPSLKVGLFKMTIHSFEKIIKQKQFLQTNGIKSEKNGFAFLFFFFKTLIESDW